MVKRLARMGFAAFLTTALAGPGLAWAQDEEEEEELGDDDDPCKGVEPPCGEPEDSGGGELASGKGDGEGEGDGEGAGEGEGEDGEKVARKGGGDGEGNGEGEGNGDDDDASASADADATIEAAPMGSSLGEGKLAINAAVKVGLSDESVGDPISIEPDVWYGVNDKLTGGIVTSSQAATGFWGAAGAGLCPIGDGCPDVFDNVGAEVLYAFKNDPSLIFAADIGFHALSIADTVFAAKVGAKGLWRSGKIGIGFAPNLFIGVTERDVNKETLNVPVDVSFMASPTLSFGVQTGISAPIDGIGDLYRVPVALGGFLMISPKISAAAAFSLDSVLSGVEGNDAIATRSLGVSLGYTM